MGYSQTIPLSSIEIGSAMENPFTVTTVAADHAFTEATITLPGWLEPPRIQHAYIDMYVPYVQNTNVASNYIDSTQYVYASVDGGAFHQCTKISNQSFYLPPSFSFTGLYRIIGMYDMRSYLVANATIDLLWDNAQSFANSLVFGNIWFIMRLIA